MNPWWEEDCIKGYGIDFPGGRRVSVFKDVNNAFFIQFSRPAISKEAANDLVKIRNEAGKTHLCFMLSQEVLRGLTRLGAYYTGEQRETP